MKTNKSKLLVVVTALLMASCFAIESGQTNSSSKHVLEPNDSYEVIWNRSDIGLEAGANQRRPSMVAVPGKIVLIGSTNSGIQTGKVIGLDSLTGDVVWTTPGVSLGEIISHGKNVYRGTYGTATIQSINAENGELLWQTLLPRAHSTSDIYFAENKIFVHTNNTEFYVLSEQGEILDSFSESEDAFLEVGGVLYMEDADGIKAVDFSSKKELWKLEVGAKYTYAPIFDNETIFFRTAGSPTDIYSIDRGTGDVNWKATYNILSNLYVTNNRIYFLNSDSYFVALDKYSGDKLGNLKFSPPLNLNEEDYFISGDLANSILTVYFGDSSQILGIKVLAP